jgi:hypothetical protein
MPSDALTFALSFAAVFAGLGGYWLHLARRLAKAGARLEAARQASAKPKSPGAQGPP